MGLGLGQTQEISVEAFHLLVLCVDLDQFQSETPPTLYPPLTDFPSEHLSDVPPDFPPAYGKQSIGLYKLLQLRIRYRCDVLLELSLMLNVVEELILATSIHKYNMRFTERAV